MNPLPKRARSVLYAVVSEFIATGEPVGSRTLTKKYGFALSPATIRNVLADLEDAGYLSQPHTSAGRLPTVAAFRFYIDALMQVQRLPQDDTSRIHEWIEELNPQADLLRETGKLLSDLSGSPAVVLRARSQHRTLLKLRFIGTRPQELLAVMVFSDGTVDNRFIQVERVISDTDLERLHNLLESIVEGRTLRDLRNVVAEGMHEHRDELASLHELGQALVRAAADGSTRAVDVVIEGQARLLERPEFGSMERVRDLFRALEDRERLVGLLDRALDSDRVQVFLGEETSSAAGYPVSLVATRYREEDGQPGGAVGVIGPTRMDYAFLVPLVAATADAMSTVIVRQREQRQHAGEPPEIDES
ncbi:MAG TPA: heat-inducible transcriptional repressor HrcA [Polyangiaceae bacterium]|nr:heat-inducible transcriptional repressor HrcA [Polyangiaceae bacterium]